MDELEAGLDELLLGERVADLDARALLLEGLVELLAGEHAGAADAVAAGLGADEHDVVADAAGDGAHDAVGADHAGAHGVDQAVALVAGLEVDLAADGGDAEAVAVVGDAADDAVEQEALARLGELAEAQRVHAHARPRAHREDVADDAADAGGGALEGLDRRRVVVALDLHGHGPAVADVDDAGVLAGALQDARPAGGEAPEDGPRVLVAAVLAPHQRVDGELHVRGLALLDLADVRVLVFGEAELDGGLEVARWLMPSPPRVRSTVSIIDWKSLRPSAPPARSASTEFSGCGIMPNTLRASLHTPAMSSRAPLGLAPSARSPAAFT